MRKKMAPRCSDSFPTGLLSTAANCAKKEKVFVPQPPSLAWYIVSVSVKPYASSRWSSLKESLEEGVKARRRLQTLTRPKIDLPSH